MKHLRVQLQPGEVLFREGDDPGTAYLIEAGSVEVRTRQRGHDVVLSLLGPGELVGEMAVIDDSPRTATATATSACTLFPIDRQQIAERLAATDPIIRSLLEGQLKRYRGALAALQGKEPAADAPSAWEQLGIGKIRLESQLREALASRQLELSYQPLSHIASSQIAGYEALVRWNHPERGPVSPAEFVALAEETSLIVPVGEYVIDTACEAIAALIAAGHVPAPFVAVNVSARQLSHPGLIERIVARVDAASLPRGSLKLEITESQVLDYTHVAAIIDLCHVHGIRVALDDFGTGYSHLCHLHRLPFDTLKVDQSFSRHMLEDKRSMAIVETIVQLGRAVSAEIVVEGIESQAQLEALRRLGCDYAQGYLVGRPRSLDQILAVDRDRPAQGLV
ncbi:EAL domain-containing protein [Arenimonas sp. MALMAid1274]|uniref:EAL domain-containing protein n=1 Tax=Arenimonas sp. MALMAid1274 TaxID=3411630 RepID=UPI003B9FD414